MSNDNSTNPTPITEPVLSGSNSPPVKKRGVRGANFHKPECACFACNARRRKEEALLDPTGDERGAEGYPTTITKLAQLNVDIPEFLTHRRDSYSRIGDWVAMRLEDPNITNKEVAERMGISPKTLNALITKASKEGWLKFENPLDKIEHEVIPKAVENLKYFLDKKDKSVTIEVAKGTIFKQFQESKGIQDAPTTVLALKIEAPDAAPQVKIITGTIMGKPRYLTNPTEDQ